MPYFSLLQVLRELDQGDPILSLALLKLPPEERERARALGRLRDFARTLDHSPNLLRGLIRHESWNYALAGGALALVTPAACFAPDLVWRIEQGTWAAPQLAAYVALLGHPDTEGLLSLALATATIDSTPKTILSCYAALDHLGSRAARDFAERPLFRTLAANDLDGSVAIARRTLRDWKAVLKSPAWRNLG